MRQVCITAYGPGLAVKTHCRPIVYQLPTAWVPLELGDLPAGGRGCQGECRDAKTYAKPLAQVYMEQPLGTLVPPGSRIIPAPAGGWTSPLYTCAAVKAGSEYPYCKSPPGAKLNKKRNYHPLFFPFMPKMAASSFVAVTLLNRWGSGSLFQPFFAPIL